MCFVTPKATKFTFPFLDVKTEQYMDVVGYMEKEFPFRWIFYVTYDFHRYRASLVYVPFIGITKQQVQDYIRFYKGHYTIESTDSMTVSLRFPRKPLPWDDIRSQHNPFYETVIHLYKV